MKKHCKTGILLWMAIVLAITSIQPFSFHEVVASAKKEIYADAACKIYYQTMSEWETGFEGQITVENVGKQPIGNWKLQFSFSQSIKSIWDGEIISHKEDTYLLKHPSWSSKIPVGEKAVIGFNGTKKGSIEAPTNCKILLDKGEVDQEAYHITYQTTSDWKDGFQGEISITNRTKQNIEGWQLEFDFSAAIQNFWTAKLVSHTGNHYVIKNDDWNSVIKPNATITLGFEGRPGSLTSEPANFKLTAAKQEEENPPSEDGLTADEKEKIEQTERYLEETKKVIASLHPERIDETVEKLRLQEGVGTAKREGNHLDITYKTGVQQSVLVSTEANPSKQVRGAETEEQPLKDSGVYRNEDLLEMKKDFSKYQEDDNCTELTNRNILLWIPMDTKWGQYDEVEIMKQIVKAEDNLDIELTILSDENATADTLKTMDQYGMVIFASHGHNAEWLLTGETYQAKKIPVMTQKSLLKREERIITLWDKKGAEDYYGVTPVWFDQNIKKNMPGTIVFNNSCGSMESDAMWDVFQKKGAAAYLGYDGTIRNEFAILNLTLFFANFIDERQSVFNSCPFFVDCYYSKKGSSFVPVGQGNYKIARDYAVKKVKKVKIPQYMRDDVSNDLINPKKSTTSPHARVAAVPAVEYAVTVLLEAIGSNLLELCASILAVQVVAYNVKLKDIMEEIKSKSAKAWDMVVNHVNVIKAKFTYWDTRRSERTYALCEVGTKDNKKYTISCLVRHRYAKNRKKFVFETKLIANDANMKQLPSLNLHLFLYRNVTKKALKKSLSSPIDRAAFTNVVLNKWYKLEIDRKTAHYSFNVKAQSSDPNVKILPVTFGRTYYCLNRTGHYWKWNHKDTVSGNLIAEPQTNFQKVSRKTLTALRKVNYRKIYIDTYKNNGSKYNEAYFANYQIHHIQPLAYGGANVFQNMFHLTEVQHTPITAWFSGY